ncbi:MAG TPA: hypothetical protein VFH58_12775 [Acidimicrobiales bacterium]|nr:hypothetical protein [Acidimicrobiales bacterium]
MAITKAAARLILRENDHYGFAGPALCLGVPDVYLSVSELDAGSGVRRRSGGPPFISATEFLEALGLSDIVSIDLPGAAHAPDDVHDLNLPLPSDYSNRFGVVIDPGTTEHIFDVRSGLTNIAEALRVGGVVIHFVPVYSYNGGYFSINPNVLHDFYHANGFGDTRAYVVMWDRYRPFAGRSRCYPYSSVLEPRHSLADRDQCRFSPHLLFFSRKKTALDTYKSPVQIEPDSGSSETSRRSPAKSLATAVLSEGATVQIAARLRRRRQLRAIRRTSFWF